MLIHASICVCRILIKKKKKKKKDSNYHRINRKISPSLLKYLKYTIIYLAKLSEKANKSKQMKSKRGGAAAE